LRAQPNVTAVTSLLAAELPLSELALLLRFACVFQHTLAHTVMHKLHGMQVRRPGQKLNRACMHPCSGLFEGIRQCGSTNRACTVAASHAGLATFDPNAKQ
jgi:hypothetical protein